MLNRILIVGLGSIGKRHLRLTRRLLPDTDIRVLRHEKCVAIPKYADGCFSSLNQALDFAPQAAIIANPATFHIVIAKQLVQAGVHILVEKPLSTSFDGVQELFAMCHERGVVLLVGYNLRFLSSLQQFASLLKENAIGRVLSVRCEVGQYLPSWRPEIDYRKTVSARRELGGGVLLELSHELDYLRWIFGEIGWVKATLCRQSSLEIDVEDTAHLILGFVPTRNGHQLIGTVNLDFVRHDATRLCTAIGENGSLRWNGLTGAVEKIEAGGSWYALSKHQHKNDESYLAEWKHFIMCINKRERPLITGEDGLKVLQIIDAACRASESGEQVQLTTSLAKKEASI